jgi:hypothetical protein
MHRDNIDGYTGEVWTVPARRLKNKLDHAVPLTPPVIALIAAIVPSQRLELGRHRYLQRGASRLQEDCCSYNKKSVIESDFKSREGRS